MMVLNRFLGVFYGHNRLKHSCVGLFRDRENHESMSQQGEESPFLESRVKCSVEYDQKFYVKVLRNGKVKVKSEKQKLNLNLNKS